LIYCITGIIFIARYHLCVTSKQICSSHGDGRDHCCCCCCPCNRCYHCIVGLSTQA